MVFHHAFAYFRNHPMSSAWNLCIAGKKKSVAIAFLAITCFALTVATWYCILDFHHLYALSGDAFYSILGSIEQYSATPLPSSRSPNRDVYNGPDGNHSLILFWTFNFFIAHLQLDEKDIATFQCGIYRCDLTKNRNYLKRSAVVIFLPRYTNSRDLPPKRQPWQRWVLQTRESPKNERVHPLFDGKINWTFTYNKESDISHSWGFYVASGKYEEGPYHVPHNMRDRILHTVTLKSHKELEDLLTVKTKLAVWLVSNCEVKDRNNYIKILQRYDIKVDIFGRCGHKDPCKRDSKCLDNLFHQYKFYIAFENSHCEDYITEKLWRALYTNMLPIVMGPSIENYEKLLPPNSFLHVNNFTTVNQLAQFIKYLNTHDDAYKFYHEWRLEYEVVPSYRHENIHLWVCDMCKRIHDPPKAAYPRISTWFSQPRMCYNY